LNHIQIDLNRTLGQVNRDIFGGFAEHWGAASTAESTNLGSPSPTRRAFAPTSSTRCSGCALPVIRYPAANLCRATAGGMASAGRGAPGADDLAWGALEPNVFGTNEFIAFCRALGASRIWP